jgi:hypothetical protein
MSNSFFKENAGELLCCMIEGMGLIVGKLKVKDTGDNHPVIKNPRAIQTQQIDKDRPPQLRLGELVGSPDEFVLVRQPVFAYKILDKKIKDLYTKSTTNLILSSTVPSLEVAK